jgi:UDP-glucose 4-epimerase
MRILVTGGAGFIGSHIQDGYIALGHDVTVFDNLSTGKKEYLNPDAEFIEGDVTVEPMVREIIRGGRFDLVNHHAAQINVRYSFDDPVRDCAVNVIGTLNVLKAMIDFEVPKIIFASTGGAIYGDTEEPPVDENAPLRPKSPYSISKLTCENYIKNLGGLYDLDYTILRYANVYGPRQIAKGEAGVVAIFTERLLDGKPPVIFGSGKHTRDYVFITDVVDANVRAAENGASGIFNIGRGIEINVHDVFDTVSKAFGDRALPYESAPEVPEVDRIALDSAKARTDLGWEPSVDFETGVKETVKSYETFGG